MRNYVQFSKKCVVGVLVSVNVLTLTALIGMMIAADFSAIGSLMNGYFSFAGVVFVAYCGNSAVEKVAVQWAARQTTNDTVNTIDNG